MLFVILECTGISIPVRESMDALPMHLILPKFADIFTAIGMAPGALAIALSILVLAGILGSIGSDMRALSVPQPVLPLPHILLTIG